MELNLIISFIGIIIGILSIFLGIWIAGRFEGKLKTALIFLIIATSIIVLRKIILVVNFAVLGGAIGIGDFLTTTNSTLIENITYAVALFFIFCAIFYIRSLVKDIDGRYRKRKDFK